MKRYLFFIAVVSIHSSLSAQVSTEGLRYSFAQTSRQTGRQTGYEGLQSYSSQDVKGSQFYLPDWSAGYLLTDSSQKVAANYEYLYDKVRQVVFMKEKDAQNVLEVDKSKVLGFGLTSNGNHQFVEASCYDPENKADFFEVLAGNDSGYTLLKLTKTKFVKFDPSDMMRMKSGVTTDEFSDDVSYYISYKHAPATPVKLKDNSIKKAFEAQKNKVENYLNNNPDSERNETYLVNLVLAINS